MIQPRERVFDEAVPFRAGIDREAVARRLVDVKERILFKIPLYGDGDDHSASLTSVLPEMKNLPPGLGAGGLDIPGRTRESA